eukprot:TRINITY_DN66586_c0_g1_i1.p1 TRINITY_DN66586_c0_g1~~TRINITY_DN66586_c0_g1_i1.p1  ORF type:complete len:163 (+),score=29.83 TRINITY_DN66586_c0_g1_i1:30-518(+)
MGGQACSAAPKQCNTENLRLDAPIVECLERKPVHPDDKDTWAPCRPAQELLCGEQGHLEPHPDAPLKEYTFAVDKMTLGLARAEDDGFLSYRSSASDLERQVEFQKRKLEVQSRQAAAAAGRSQNSRKLSAVGEDELVLAANKNRKKFLQEQYRSLGIDVVK